MTTIDHTPDDDALAVLTPRARAEALARRQAQGAAPPMPNKPPPDDSIELRPFADDTSAADIVSTFDLDSANWILTRAGDYIAAAVEGWKRDGTNWQDAVILEWPGTRRTTGEATTVRLAMSPEDAIGLAKTLAHSAGWALLRRDRQGDQS